MLYYSHVNEDNRVERNLFQASGCTELAAVAGSGERIIALMDGASCRNIHAIDVNEEALFLLQLKLTALEKLPVKDYLQFIGHDPASGTQRVHWFNSFKETLSGPAKLYWEKNVKEINNGILYAGHFEKFLQRVRKPVTVFLGKDFQTVLIEPGYKLNRYSSLKWKMIRGVFSCKWVYKLWGNRDPAFIGKNAAIPQIPNALNQSVRTGEAASSFMFHLVFKGHLRDMNKRDIPPSLNPELLQKIKERLLSKEILVRYHLIDILTYAGSAEKPRGKSFYSLSDLLSFENLDYLNKVLALTFQPGNTIVWRSFLKNRVDTGNAGRSEWLYGIPEDHSSEESTRMYQVFSLKNS